MEEAADENPGPVHHTRREMAEIIGDGMREGLSAQEIADDILIFQGHLPRRRLPAAPRRQGGDDER